MGCRDEIGKYQRPDWLAGKVYTQILEQPELTTFATAVELTGYDAILDVSGSYTVFAPSNQAFQEYFSSNPNYNSIESVPIAELSRIVKYHIVQNPWSKIQLRTLDIYGWIDTLDITNNEPKGFKRETLLLDKDQKYGISLIGEGRNTRRVIVDTLKTNFHRRAATDSRKFVPIFFQEYFNIYDLEKSDYQFYFDRAFESPSDIYYAGAKITSDEIFAENGFVYIIDKVVEPLDNAYQILSKTDGLNQYTDLLELVNVFPEFEYNEEKTFDQPGADQGLAVDSLFELTYPDLTFDLNNEKTSPPSGTYGLPQNVTIRYHHGLMAPTNSSFQQFVRDYIQIPNGWGTLNGAPEHIKRIIANTYLAINPIYPSDFDKGFYNGELDIVRIDPANIVEKHFGSNTTFIGLNEAIVPRAFKSVTGPVYLKQGFSKVMYAIERSGLLPALKRENKEYMFFVESDANTAMDSSLMYNPNNEAFSVILRAGAAFQSFPLNTDDLRTLLLNHVAIATPKGIAKKEFIPNLAGNYIIINNETGEVSGTGTTTNGYNGTVPEPEFPKVLSGTADNGTTYEINNWFSFTGSSLFTKLLTNYPKFHNLIRKAGLSKDKEFRYTFVSDNEFYTVLVPSDAALDSADVNSMPKEELIDFLQLHFIQGDLIFTDGNKSPGYFETVRKDESSTPFSVVYTKIYIDPKIDQITIRGKNTPNYVDINENEGTTNILTAVNLSTGGQSIFPQLFNNGVVHEIDKVLKIEELDTN